MYEISGLSVSGIGAENFLRFQGFIYEEESEIVKSQRILTVNSLFFPTLACVES